MKIHIVRSNDTNCSKCGGTHKHRARPALGKECAKCHKLNHFQKVCRSKEISRLNRFKSPQRLRSHERDRDFQDQPKQNLAQRVVHSIDETQNFLVGVLSVRQKQ